MMAAAMASMSRRRPRGPREVRDAEHPAKPLGHLLVRWPLARGRARCGPPARAPTGRPGRRWPGGVSDELGDEPRPVLPLERDFLVVDDDGIIIRHLSVAVVRALGKASDSTPTGPPPRERVARAWPLTTAPSIVAGRPVSVQSPASKRPRTGVRVAGRGGWPGASEKVARRSRTTTLRSSRSLAGAGDRGAKLGEGERASASFDSLDHGLRPAGDEREVRRGIPEDLPLVEDPLERPPWQADERTAEQVAIEPEVHGDDGRGRRSLGSADDARQRTRFHR